MSIAVLSRADLASQLRACERSLVEATTLAAKLGRNRAHYARWVHWTSKRDRLLTEQRRLRAALAIAESSGIGAGADPPLLPAGAATAALLGVGASQ